MIAVLLIVGLIGSVLWIIGWIRAAVGTVSRSISASAIGAGANFGWRHPRLTDQQRRSLPGG